MWHKVIVFLKKTNFSPIAFIKRITFKWQGELPVKISTKNLPKYTKNTKQFKSSFVCAIVLLLIKKVNKTSFLDDHCEIF